MTLAAPTDTGDAGEIAILHEESGFLLLNKPSGLFSQAAPGIESVETCLRKQLKQRKDAPVNPYVGLPHRLDRSTSGVMLIARNQRALARFNQQFQSRKIGKFYLVVLEGTLAAGVSRWDDYVRKIPDVARAEIAERDTQGARHASLDIAPLAQSESSTLAIVHLHTGRMHQIRIQASSRGTPVFGDLLYGANDSASQLSPELGRVRVDSQPSQKPLDATTLASVSPATGAGSIFVGTARLPAATGDALAAKAASKPADHPGSARYLSQQPIGLHALRLEFRHPRTGRLVAGTAPVPAESAAFRQFASQVAALSNRSSQLESAVTLEQVVDAAGSSSY